MGGAEKFNDSKSTPPQSTPERRVGEEHQSAVNTAESQPPAAPLSQSRPPVRRSSLRPAPASYRPSARDPATLRPMMVVRAGDAEPVLSLEEMAPEPSQPLQTPSDTSAKVQPFALAEELSVYVEGGGTSPLVIPPPPAVPIDLLPKTDVLTQPSEDPVAVASHFQLSGDATAITSDFSHPERSASVKRHGPAPLKRQNYRPIAFVLTGVVLVGAVALALRRHRPIKAIQAPQIQAQVRSTPPHPSAVPASNAPPIVDESSGKIAAAEPATTAAFGAILPAASAALDTTRVTLELKPLDAKVYYLGRLQSGPPFAFDVAKGQRIAVEVVRFGFVTAKVVIDDKKPVISFGMLHERYHPKPE